jgi:hypothetical protein
VAFTYSSTDQQLALFLNGWMVASAQAWGTVFSLREYKHPLNVGVCKMDDAHPLQASLGNIRLWNEPFVVGDVQKLARRMTSNDEDVRLSNCCFRWLCGMLISLMRVQFGAPLPDPVVDLLAPPLPPALDGQLQVGVAQPCALREVLG